MISFTRINAVVFFAILFCLISCSSDNDPELSTKSFVDRYGGESYRGDAISELSGPDDLEYEWLGRSTVSVFEPTDDSVSIAYRIVFDDDEGEINLKFRGSYSEDGFSLVEENFVFNVSQGEISGGGTNDFQDWTFEGTLTDTKVNTIITVFFREEMDNFPKNATLKIDLQGFREINDDEDDDSSTGCQVIVVPVIGAGGVELGLVPDCN